MLGHGKHNLPDEQQQADPLVCVQHLRRDREDHGQHVVPDGRHRDNRTDIYVQRLRPTYTDEDGETRTVREETNLTYDGNGNILAEAVTEAYSGSTTKTRTYQYDLGNRLISAMSPRTILSWIRGETPERDRRAYILRKCRTVEISQDSRAESIYFYKWR